jgi:hypothetical protein
MLLRNANNVVASSLIISHDRISRMLLGINIQIMYPFNSHSQSYVTIDVQSAGLSWWQSPIWGPRPHFYYYQTVADLLIQGTLSEKRTGVSLTISDGPRQRSHTRVQVTRDSWLYFYCLRSDTPRTWRARLLYLYFLGIRSPNFPPRHSVPIFVSS